MISAINIKAFRFVLFLFLSFSFPLFATDAQESVPVVVTCQWLENNLSDPDIVVLHVSTVLQDFDNGHIPGASFLWPGWLSVSTEKESTVPADIKKIRKTLEGQGVSNNSHIVLYGVNGNFVPVCRVFVTLDHIGMGKRVSILDGGLDEWRLQGRIVSVTDTPVRKGKLNISVQNNLVNTEWIMQNMDNKDYCIIDARPEASYDGTIGIPRQGHIPGAKNLPATGLYNSKTSQFNQPDKLTELFSSLHIPEGIHPVFYCNTGNSACVDYVAAIMAGYSPLLYDGSMEMWGSRFDLPVEKH